MKQLEIFTDGACKGNPGPGGWGAVIRYGKHEKEISGGDPDTTNNRMELSAAIHALKILIEPCHVKLHTDSKYVLDGITKWIHGWQRNGWKNASKQGYAHVAIASNAMYLIAFLSFGLTWLMPGWHSKGKL